MYYTILFFCPVVPGTKRNKVDFHTVEQEAGRAVLKLLDAKIGKYVLQAIGHLFTPYRFGVLKTKSKKQNERNT